MVDRLGTCSDGTRLATCDGGLRLAGCQPPGEPPPFDYPCGSIVRVIVASYNFCRLDNDDASFAALDLGIRTGAFWRARFIQAGQVVGEYVHGLIAINAGGFADVDIAAARAALVAEFGLASWPTPDVSLNGVTFPGGVRTRQFIAQRGTQPFFRFDINTANPTNPTAPNVDEVQMNVGTPLCGSNGGRQVFTRVEFPPPVSPYPDADPNLAGAVEVYSTVDGVETERRGVYAHRPGLYVPPDFVSPCPGFQPGTFSPPPGMPDPGEYSGMGAAANRGGCCG